MDDDELTIDLSKIKKLFKKTGEALEEDKEEPDIKKEIKKEKQKISELEEKEIKEEEKLEKLEEEQAKLETTKEEIKEKKEELKEIHKEEDRIIKELAQEEKKIDKIEKETKTITEEEISIDWNKHLGFLKNNKKIVIPTLLIIIAIFFSTFFRMYPAELPITDDWAKQNVYNYYKNQIKTQIDAQYPNLPNANKQGLIDNEFEKFLETNSQQLEKEIDQTSQYFKTKMKDEEGQTYLLAIDPYLWYGEARNYLKTGHFGTETVNGEEINYLRNGREGRKMPNIKLHSLIGAWMQKIRSLYSNASLMNTFFMIPVIIIGLSIIPAFYIGQRVGGNTGGFFSAMILALNSALLSRTPAGFADTDPYNIFFPLLIGWLFLEAYYAKTNKNKMILAALAGLGAGIFSKAWGGWWYIVAFLTAAIVLYTINDFLKNKEKLKDTIKTGAIFLISTSICVSLISGLKVLTNAIYNSPLSVIFLKEVAVTTLWPNVLTTVAEFNEAPLGELINQMGGNLLFSIAIIGILLTIFAKTIRGKKDTKYAIFLTIWFLGTAYGFTKGVRFAILMVPAFAIAFGAGAGIIYNYASRFLTKELKVPKAIGKTVLTALLLLLLIQPIKDANAVAKGEIPSMNDAWYESLTTIKEDSTDAIITSWWDFGHWFVAIAERRVTFDGADQGERIHWVGKSLLTSNEEQAVGILKMLNCGQEKAPHVIEEILGGDTVRAIDLLNEIMLLDKEGAIKRLAKEGMTNKEIADVIKVTHCEDLIDQYYITSEDMIGKAGVWGHFGSWDFEKAKMWQTVKKQDYETGIKTLTTKFNLTEEEADQTYYEIQEHKADQWVSPWPSYMSQAANCQQQGETLTCTNGALINMTTMEAYAMTQQGKIKLNSIAYIDEKGEFKMKNLGGEAGASVTLIPGKTPKSIILDPKLAGSMFTRLFFLNGQGLKHFQLLTEKTQITGGKIQVWKVNWEPGEAIDTLKEQEEIRASHILISTDNRTSEEALTIAREVKAKINDTNFEETAKEHSEGPTGPNGGDLGWFGKGQMVQEFEKAAFALKKGEVSQPIKTQFGWHIIKVTDKKGEQTTATVKKETTNNKTKEFEITI